LQICREKRLPKKRLNAIFIFNRKQALAKLTWWLADSNVTGNRTTRPPDARSSAGQTQRVFLGQGRLTR
jgi:hypothetical protein